MNVSTTAAMEARLYTCTRQQLQCRDRLDAHLHRFVLAFFSCTAEETHACMKPHEHLSGAASVGVGGHARLVWSASIWLVTDALGTRVSVRAFVQTLCCKEER